MTVHFLKLNCKKTEIMEIHLRGSQKHIRSVEVEGAVLPMKKNVKSLGVCIDEKLSFDHHVNEVVRTCNYRLKNLARIGSKLTENLKITLVQNYILTKLDYCNVVLTSLNQRLLKRLESVLNAALVSYLVSMEGFGTKHTPLLMFYCVNYIFFQWNIELFSKYV